MTGYAKTLQRKKAFLEEFRKCGNVTTAARLVGLSSRWLVYPWKEHDPEFAAAFAAAEQEATEHFEEEARRRAIEGTEKPVYQGGQQVGTIREYSDLLLIFMLKARAPDKYRERYDVKHTGDSGSGDSLTVPAEDLAAIREELRRRHG